MTMTRHGDAAKRAARGKDSGTRARVMEVVIERRIWVSGGVSMVWWVYVCFGLR